jgi:hypothetical protein
MSSGKVGVKRGVFICKNIYNRYSDLDAKQFMYASGISNNQIKDAIYRLCIDLKMAGIFTKCTAIYPFVGGTATTHRFNLRDPRDLNAAFRLQFFGGGTHSATGYSPGGVNGYADTFLVPNTSLQLNSVHLSYYSRTNQTFTDVLLGAADASYNNGLYLLPKNTPNNEYTRMNQSVFTNPTGHANTFGFFAASRIISTEFRSYRNGNLINTIPANSSGLTSLKIFIGSANISPIQYTSCECAFSSIGAGLTASETAIYNSIVQSFQTTLGRNV